ncbi:MAG: 4Fe-4S dicluster domain-containing protein [Candidatus Bathyarchaeota archaeon]|jgi:2-oxoglutarate ferredoxin oxidoreductase subunit delta
MGKIEVDEKFCKGCALCVETCAQHLIRIAKHITPQGYHPAEFVDPEKKCTGCTLCALICPDAVIEVYRQKRKEVA